MSDQTPKEPVLPADYTVETNPDLYGFFVVQPLAKVNGGANPEPDEEEIDRLLAMEVPFQRLLQGAGTLYRLSKRLLEWETRMGRIGTPVWDELREVVASIDVTFDKK